MGPGVAHQPCVPVCTCSPVIVYARSPSGNPAPLVLRGAKEAQKGARWPGGVCATTQALSDTCACIRGLPFAPCVHPHRVPLLLWRLSFDSTPTLLPLRNPLLTHGFSHPPVCPLAAVLSPVAAGLPGVSAGLPPGSSRRRRRLEHPAYTGQYLIPAASCPLLTPFAPSCICLACLLARMRPVLHAHAASSVSSHPRTFVLHYSKHHTLFSVSHFLGLTLFPFSHNHTHSQDVTKVVEGLTPGTKYSFRSRGGYGTAAAVAGLLSGAGSGSSGGAAEGLTWGEFSVESSYVTAGG
jgi:hypothetical protein